jgi:hypothetical protein
MLELAPPFAERVRAGHREARFIGMAVPNFSRRPFGLGWALVGDTGYNEDFITAQGITDAFRDAELCATALDETLSGLCSFRNPDMGTYRGKWSPLDPDMSPCQEARRSYALQQVQTEAAEWMRPDLGHDPGLRSSPLR